MPELPEAETIARELGAVIVGRIVGAVEVARRDIVHGDVELLEGGLKGRRVNEVYRRAKRVIVRIEGGGELTFRLGMTGRVEVCRADAPLEKHTHIRIAFRGRSEARMEKDGHIRIAMRGQAGARNEKHARGRIESADQEVEVRFRDPRRFGGVWCRERSTTEDESRGEGDAGRDDRRTRREAAVVERVGRNERVDRGRESVGAEVRGPEGRGAIARGASGVHDADGEEDLGPEPLELTAREFRGVLGRSRQIKALLMDQRAIAGLGNIYCDEALHAAGIHPLRRANSLDGGEAKRLLRCIKDVLRRAIRHNGTTLMDYRRVDGAEGSFQRHHRVYQREGEGCRRCGTSIERIRAAGRSTFLCPRCQPKESGSQGSGFRLAPA